MALSIYLKYLRWVVVDCDLALDLGREGINPIILNKVFYKLLRLKECKYHS